MTRREANHIIGLLENVIDEMDRALDLEAENEDGPIGVESAEKLKQQLLIAQAQAMAGLKMVDKAISDGEEKVLNEENPELFA